MLSVLMIGCCRMSVVADRQNRQVAVAVELEPGPGDVGLELKELRQVEHVLLGTHLLNAVLELVQVDLVQGDARRLQPAPVDLVHLQPEVTQLRRQVPAVVVEWRHGPDSQVRVQDGTAHVLADALDAVEDVPALREGRVLLREPVQAIGRALGVRRGRLHEHGAEGFARIPPYIELGDVEVEAHIERRVFFSLGEVAPGHASGGVHGA